ncbi:unnamed protein product, partial [marine sediment metagenome]
SKTEIAELSAEEVWAYITRILTNLPDVRAARIDNLDVLLSTRLSKAFFDSEMTLIKNMPGSSFDSEDDSLEAIGTEHHHITQIFPEDTNETITFTAGGTDNTWSSWAEIDDNNGVKFSDKLTSPTHLTAFLIEACNVKDKAYLLEVAYGDAKTLVARYRFIAGETTKLPPIQQVRIRSEHIPAGEKVYYRMKCEAAGKTCQLHIRYYQHT